MTETVPGATERDHRVPRTAAEPFGSPLGLEARAHLGDPGHRDRGGEPCFLERVAVGGVVLAVAHPSGATCEPVNTLEVYPFPSTASTTTNWSEAVVPSSRTTDGWIHTHARPSATRFWYRPSGPAVQRNPGEGRVCRSALPAATRDSPVPQRRGPLRRKRSGLPREQSIRVAGAAWSLPTLSSETAVSEPASATWAGRSALRARRSRDTAGSACVPTPVR